MGNSKYLDSLTPEQYRDLTVELCETQSYKCFICNEEIDLDVHTTNIDHIKPLSRGGSDSKINFAVTHESCNKSKQDEDLVVARAIAELNKIRNKADENGETVSLRHVLSHFGGSKFQLNGHLEGNEFKYSFEKMGDNKVRTLPVYTDNLSKEKSVFIEVPIEYLYHDDAINPRGLNSSVNSLIIEFYKTNPQLQVGLARYDDNQVKLFDGQHKTVAQLMLGVKTVVVRLFINPNYERLFNTNLRAGKDLKQIAFDKSIVRQLHNGLYNQFLTRYRSEKGLTDDDMTFSEQDIVDYFKGDPLKKYIIDSQKNSITYSSKNQLTQFIYTGGRAFSHPLSYSNFEKTILSIFINSRTILKTPLDFKNDDNPRLLELDQTVKICNIIAKTLLIGRFDAERGKNKIEEQISKGNYEGISIEHLVSCRMFKEEVFHGWVPYLKKIIENIFLYTATNYDSDNIMQNKIPDAAWTNIENFLINLRDLPLWKNYSLSSTIFGSKTKYEYWDSIFRNGNAPDGVPVMAGGINVLEMIKPPNQSK